MKRSSRPQRFERVTSTPGAGPERDQLDNAAASVNSGGLPALLEDTPEATEPPGGSRAE